MAAGRDDDVRDGISFSHLDEELFDGAGVTKRELVDYLDVMADRLVPVLRDRPLSTIRVRAGQAPFMQKNLPRYAPDWIPRVDVWAQASQRTVSYALCNDRRTLLWFANQRAVEYHVTLSVGDDWMHPTHAVLDLDPPAADRFNQAVRVAVQARHVLRESGLDGVVKTSGSKGLHIYIPVHRESVEDVAAATRALAARVERLDPALATTAFVREERGDRVFVDSTRAGGATVVAAYSPRARPGVPVSFPVAWADLDRVTPADFTIRTVPEILAGRDLWAQAMPPPQRLPLDLVEEGHGIPIARVAAMHAGKRRKRGAGAGTPPPDA
ncbi:MAG: ATP-dependent DNA ligase [Micromonosporaceae bacterium]|nr:ATP-dependent DNA ligase [Micromonosporaceae bacterium]